MTVQLLVRYCDLPCPTCGASPTRPCVAGTGRVHRDFRYVHAARRDAWWMRERERNEQAKK